MSQEKDKPTTLVPYKRTNLVQTYSATNMFSLLIVLTITTTTLANGSYFPQNEQYKSNPPFQIAHYF